MLDTIQFATSYPNLWNELNKLFNAKDRIFPCLYAISSFNKHAMFFGVSSAQISIEELANDLQLMSLFLSSERNEVSKTFNTYVHIIQQHDTKNVGEFLINLLKELHKVDKKEWVKNATKDINHHEFKFSFNGQLWIPILLTPNHPSTIRRSPHTLIAFQPNITFEYNKVTKSKFYNKMRASIHNRIDDFYKQNRPYYLSNKSSGKNIVQFIGLDFEEI